MPPLQHNDDQDELTERVPGAAEGILVVGNARRDADETECGDGLEEDGVDVEAGGGDGEGVTFDDTDEEEGYEYPPGV